MLWDHPRVCGEKAASYRSFFAGPGSPPRMRGKAAGASVGRLAVGITPAYAGKRFCYGWQKPLSGDHPRVCGEKYLQRTRWTQETGSPPRMRGKAACRKSLMVAAGITPAYAGKSKRNTGRELHSGDHPRVCGEKCTFPLFQILQSGITPAYAGKRCSLFRHPPRV